MIIRRTAAAASGVLAALALAATLLTAGPAAAAPGGAADPATFKVDTSFQKPTKSSIILRAEFAAQGRAAGLNATQAGLLQGKVNGYLEKLGGAATQTDFNTIALKGADLHVTVPGELHPRGLDGTYCAYKWFCAYEGEYQMYDEIKMYDCNIVHTIPWYTTGSWVNNQTPGTRPLLTFLDNSTWRMPGAYAQQLTGVGWSPVWKIDPC